MKVQILCDSDDSDDSDDDTGDGGSGGGSGGSAENPLDDTIEIRSMISQGTTVSGTLECKREDKEDTETEQPFKQFAFIKHKRQIKRYTCSKSNPDNCGFKWKTVDTSTKQNCINVKIGGEVIAMGDKNQQDVYYSCGKIDIDDTNRIELECFGVLGSNTE